MEHGGGDGKPWTTTISVPPSKAVRDGVCFRGLCVLLFVVEEEEQQQATAVRNRGTGFVRSVGVGFPWNSYRTTYILRVVYCSNATSIGLVCIPSRYSNLLYPQSRVMGVLAFETFGVVRMVLGWL